MAVTTVQHRELAFIFGVLGNIIAFAVFLAPLPTFWRIYKRKSTEGFQCIPYAVALFSATLLLYYAFLKEGNATMIITINTIGCIVEGFYLTIYMIYAPRNARVYAAKVLGILNLGLYGLIVVTTLVFVRGSDHKKLVCRGGKREQVVGWACAVVSVCVFASPLSIMRTVLRTKSVDFMPFWLSFFLTVSAVTWFCYGFLIQDFYIASPNVLGFVLGITQMIMYIIYKGSNKTKEEMELEKDDIKLEELVMDSKPGSTN